MDETLILADMVSLMVMGYKSRLWYRFNEIPGAQRRETLNELAPRVLEYAATLFEDASMKYKDDNDNNRNIANDH